jgi:hypothetical protein
MRELAPPDGLWDAWRGVLVSYAEAQIELSQRRREILATGLPEVSPTTSPVLARELLDDLARQPADEGGLNAEQVAAVEARLPEFDDRCAELAASGIPDSVEHNDLHSANVCVRTPSGSHAAEVRIIDWGDAHWGHPLGTMLATLNSMAYHVGVFEDGQPIKDARVLRMRDAYLEPFTRFDSHANLVRYVDLARRTGCLGKALANRSALMGEPVATHAEYEFPVREWFLGITQ